MEASRHCIGRLGSCSVQKLLINASSLFCHSIYITTIWQWSIYHILAVTNFNIIIHLSSSNRRKELLFEIVYITQRIVKWCVLP